MDSLNSGVEQLVGDLFCLFRYSGPINRKYEALAEILDFEPLKFVRHVETRWLQLLPVVQVVLKQYDLLIQFFQENSENLSIEKDRVERIMTALRNAQTKATLLMLEDTLRPMEKFEKLFQRRNVQIHKLWNEMNQLLKSFLLRFIEKAAIKSPSFRTEFTKRENWLVNSKILLGEATAAEVASMTEEDRQMFFANACRFLESAAAALLHYLPFQNKVLRFCRLLNPQKRKRDYFEAWVKSAAKHLHVPSSDMTNLLVEARLYQQMNISDSDEPDLLEFWQEVKRCGHVPMLIQPVRKLLILPHGNAECERAFSIMKADLRDNRLSLSDETVRGLLVTR